MPKLAIVKLLHSALRRQAEPVPAGAISSPRIQRLISDMKDTLAKAPDGVGLAAPQVNVPLRVFIVSSEASSIDANMRMNANDTNIPQKWEYHAFINPVLKKRSREKTVMAEGCLSVPGKFGEVGRAGKVYLEWHDERGKKHGRGFTKFFARVVQHELDHLDGVLITDRAKRLVAIHDGPGAGHNANMRESANDANTRTRS